MISEEDFCRMIEKDYIYYMYKAERGYPFNCHTSANLISSYLSVHFNKNFIHRTQKNKSRFHGWTKGGNICIDFTGIQFGLGPNREKLMNPLKSLSKNKVFEITQKHRNDYPIIVNGNMDDWYAADRNDKLGTEQLHGLEYARKVDNPYSIEGFMDYIKEAFEEVDKKVSDCYSCS